MAVQNTLFCHQIYGSLAMAIVLMLLHNCCWASAYVAHRSRGVHQRFDEQLNANEDNTIFNLDVNKNSPFLSNFPGLRELFLTTDYDDDEDAQKTRESNEIVVSRFMERLQQIASSAGGFDENSYSTWNKVKKHVDSRELPDEGTSFNTISLKEHASKKNAQYRKQYMSPCHFKICNMGRKRNARFIMSY